MTRRNDIIVLKSAELKRLFFENVFSMAFDGGISGMKLFQLKAALFKHKLAAVNLNEFTQRKTEL